MIFIFSNSCKSQQRPFSSNKNNKINADKDLSVINLPLNPFSQTQISPKKMYRDEISKIRSQFKLGYGIHDKICFGNDSPKVE